MARPVTVETTLDPLTSLVTSDEVKAWLGVQTDDVNINAILDNLTHTASEEIDGPESLTGVCWRQRTVRCIYEGDWPDLTNTDIRWNTLEPGIKGYFNVVRPAPQNQRIAIQYYDTSDAIQTYTGDEFHIVTFLHRDYLPVGGPPVNFGGEVRIEYVTANTTIPHPIKTAALMYIADLWSNRQAQLPIDLKPNRTIQSILNKFSNNRYFEG